MVDNCIMNGGKKMNFAFYISGTGTRLRKFLERDQDSYVEDIKLVISDAPIEEKLRKLLDLKNILFFEFNYSDLLGANKEKNLHLSNFMLEKLKEFKIDYLISFGSHILSGALLQEYEYRLINFHPAILPMYPGCKSIDQAEKHGNTMLVGNTAHFIDKGIDTGTIILQSVIPINDFLKTRDYDIILDIQIEMLEKLLLLLKKQKIEVKNGRVNIIGADYSKYSIFPNV